MLHLFNGFSTGRAVVSGVKPGHRSKACQNYLIERYSKARAKIERNFLTENGQFGASCYAATLIIPNRLSVREIVARDGPASAILHRSTGANVRQALLRRLARNKVENPKHRLVSVNTISAVDASAPATRVAAATMHPKTPPKTNTIAAMTKPLFLKVGVTP